MLDIIKDTLIDALKLLPFLFVAFLIIELIEHKLSDKTKDVISKSGKVGPLYGSILGAIPQCGFSVIATNLYVTRIITLGTLISIYLSTSDEMLPILLSSKVDIRQILLLVGIKVLIGMLFGFIIDLIYRKKKEKDFHICDDNDCDCEESILKSSIIHTLKTLGFITLFSFGLNILFYYVGEEVINKIFMSESVFAPFLASMIGLIPNCGASVVITELFINGFISLGTTTSGLLTGAGISLLVLFKSNKSIKENIIILLMIYFIGVISGVVINLLSILF